MHIAAPLRIKRLTAIARVQQLVFQHPYLRIIIRIDSNLAEVGVPAGLAHLLPTLSLIFAAKNPTLRVLEQRVNDVRLLRIDGKPDPPRVAVGGQSIGQLLPAPSSIGCLVNRAPRTASVETPGCAPALIAGGIKSIGALRIDRHIHDARVLIDKEHLAPRVPPYRRLVHPALRVRSPQMPQRNK